MSEFKSVKASHGGNGWGGPLIITPTAEKPYVLSVTLGGISPVALRIAELTGAEAHDQFKDPIETDQACAVVIDCAGVARCGTYPKMGLKTLNIKPGSPSGPLAQFITEDLFASDVNPDCIALVDAADVPAEPVKTEKAYEETTKENVHAKIAEGRAEIASKQSNGVMDVVSKIGTGVGRVISIIYQAARDTVNDVIRNIIPFMAFVSVLIGIINYTGFANVLAGVLTPLAGSLPGMLAIGMFLLAPE